MAFFVIFSVFSSTLCYFHDICEFLVILGMFLWRDKLLNKILFLSMKNLKIYKNLKILENPMPQKYLKVFKSLCFKVF